MAVGTLVKLCICGGNDDKLGVNCLLLLQLLGWVTARFGPGLSDKFEYKN